MKLQRTLALCLFIAQGAITVTGSIVRVTGSGLGCNTWPKCHPDSLIPVAGAAPAIHQAIEFGNRMLTFVLVAIAVAVLVMVYKAKRRDEIIRYAWFSILGIVLQAIIGGISVRLDLRWWAVAIHFLPSMVLVWIGAILYQRISQADDGTIHKTFSAGIRILAVISAIAMSIVLVTGTMTTGAGVHSGDKGVGMEGRLEVDIDLMAHIHGWLMYAYLFCVIALLIWLRRSNALPISRKYGMFLVLAIVAQAIIGIAQYRLGVPRYLVPVHIGMSAVVVAFTALLYGSGRWRSGGTALKTGSCAAEEIYEAK
ncbi:COX15/CtaA family protein [Corynebacterium caspium]|uniref:COX15/CtaA family protein n=1 Tax=Corynebacterium caspium TaxID=234828 RepID=UPI000684DB54|nr:heme A synthase [Corynebacterium caspium]